MYIYDKNLKWCDGTPFQV